jgi:threonylcarbamoyladenosine tRNA methylthiotransferase MtaB
VSAGHVEVVLTGVDLGHYGWDLEPRTTLAALVRRLLDVRGLGWLRLSSVLPAYFTEELIELVVGDRRICRHLHVPLQSGADRVLRAMRRPYTVRMYRALAERLASAIPGLGLGADIIAGFPGETAAEHDATAALVEALPFSYLHVFPYSDRQGTESARGAVPRVPPAMVRERTGRLRGLGAAKQAAFRRAQIGQDLPVLVLERRERGPGRLVGLTDNYLELAFSGPQALMRGLARVRATGQDGKRLEGVLVSDG